MTKRIVLAFFGGLLSLFAFAPFSFWPAYIAGLSMLFVALKEIERVLHGYALGFLFGLGLYLPLLKWSGEYVGALPWLALATLQAGYVGLFGALSVRLHSAIALASLWVFCEALASRFPWGGFGWGRVAYTQVEAPYVALVTLAGATLLSFSVVVLAACIAYRKFSPLLIALLIPLALAQQLPISTTEIKVAAVQGNVPHMGLDFNAQREAVLDNHLREMVTIDSGAVDLVVLPENASDVDPFGVADKISQAVTQVGVPTLIGGVPVVNGRMFNASILWDPQLGPTDSYYKQELAPFGEFMPLRKISQALVPEAKRVVDFTPGKSVKVFDVAKFRVAPVICFEVLNDGIIREAVNFGAEILAVQTNSATFGRTPESSQQLAITRLRSIEHQRSIVSASTSGISALIRPDGSVVSKSSLGTAVVLQGSLPLNRQRTLADRLGGWSEAVLCLIWLLPWLTHRRKRSS